ncbi:hypothetical protein IWGMT90018_45310 [Mycobacterium kiyosense]|nr:hypothetical protein IWGMT90018_45310 [Mycobacterium kiyosense]
MTTTTDTVPAELVVDFDVYDPALAAPKDVFQQRVQELAAVGPVVYSPHYGGHWVVTQYKEVAEVLRDPARFSSYPNNLVPHGFGKFIPLEYDPPLHTVLRHALQPLFNPNRMNALEPQIRAIVTELIDGFAARGSAEYISEFAHELPARVFLALMGWPLQDAPMFTEATDTTLHGVPGGTEEESAAARAAAAARMMNYFGAVVTDRRNRSVDASDVTASIINSYIEIDGEVRQFTDEELCNIFMLLLIAGLHTTQGSLAWGIIHLAAHPDQRATPGPAGNAGRRSQPDSCRSGRGAAYGGGSLHGTPGGARHRTGRCAAAGRRSDVGHARRCQPRRTGVRQSRRRASEPHPEPAPVLRHRPAPMPGLSSGPRRVELRIAFEELLRRLPDIEPDPDRPSVSNTAQVRGVLELHTRFTPEAQPAQPTA